MVKRVDSAIATRGPVDVQGGASGSVELRGAASRSVALPSTARRAARLTERRTAQPAGGQSARASAGSLVLQARQRTRTRGVGACGRRRWASRTWSCGPANSDVEPACDARSATNDELCDVGAECGARDAAICHATAVKEGASRALLEEKR